MKVYQFYNQEFVIHALAILIVLLFENRVVA